MGAYRSSDAADAVVAPTRAGPLRLELAPHAIALRLDERVLQLVGRQLTIEGRRERRTTRTLAGGLWVARGAPSEELGVWEEAEGGAIRRIFGAQPVALLAPEAFEQRRELDRLAARLKAALVPHAGTVVRAIEIGRGLDKVLVLDDGDRYRVHQRPLFRDATRWAFEAYRDGRIVVPDGNARREVRCQSRFGVRVIGDYLWFADADGADLARVSMPWIGADDRAELARRIGELIDAG